MPMTVRSILVVDDDPQVRRLVCVLLAREGVELVQAGDGLEALELCRSRKVPVDVLITDVTMPGMDGIELASHVSRLFPLVNVLYISGICDCTLVQHELAEKGYHFIRKPFKIAELLAIMSDIFVGQTA